MITTQVWAASWQLEWNPHAWRPQSTSHTHTPSCQQKAKMPTTLHTAHGASKQQTCCHAPTNANCRSSLPFRNGSRGSFSLSRAWLTRRMLPAEQQYNEHAWCSTVSGQTLVSPQGATRHIKNRKNTLACNIVPVVRVLKCSSICNPTISGSAKCAHVFETNSHTIWGAEGIQSRFSLKWNKQDEAVLTLYTTEKWNKPWDRCVIKASKAWHQHWRQLGIVFSHMACPHST